MKIRAFVWAWSGLLVAAATGMAQDTKAVQEEWVVSYEAAGGLLGLESKLMVMADGTVSASKKLAGSETSGRGKLDGREVAAWADDVQAFFELEQLQIDDCGGVADAIRYEITAFHEGRLKTRHSCFPDGEFAELKAELEALQEAVLSGQYDPADHLFEVVVDFPVGLDRTPVTRGLSVSRDGEASLWEFNARGVRDFHDLGQLGDQEFRLLEDWVAEEVSVMALRDDPVIIIDRRPHGGDMTSDLRTVTRSSERTNSEDDRGMSRVDRRAEMEVTTDDPGVINPGPPRGPAGRPDEAEPGVMKLRLYDGQLHGVIERECEMSSPLAQGFFPLILGWSCNG